MHEQLAAVQRHRAFVEKFELRVGAMWAQRGALRCVLSLCASLLPPHLIAAKLRVTLGHQTAAKAAEERRHPAVGAQARSTPRRPHIAAL